MDITTIITPKEIHFRNVVWRLGLPMPIMLDLCYTQYGFLIPFTDNYAILGAMERKRYGAVSEHDDGFRGVILTPDDRVYLLRFYNDRLIYNEISKEHPTYCVSEDAESNPVAAAINFLTSPHTHPDFQKPMTARQIIKTIENNYPSVGDFMVLKRKDILAELKERFPKTLPLPLNDDIKGKK